MKFVWRWAFRLFLVLVVLVVALLLLKDTLAKSYVERRLRSETGLETRIGRLDIGLLTPTVTFEQFRLYNPPEFGGSPFLDLPELHLEYDRDAVLAGKLRFKLLRVALAELNVVENRQGQKNVLALQQRLEQRLKNVAPASQLEFAGIDTLNLTLRHVRLTDLRQPSHSRELDLGVRNEIITGIKTRKDLATALTRLLINRAGALLLDFQIEEPEGTKPPAVK
jgi:uncharacterized protein involved in outer membrane biogenesis